MKHEGFLCRYAVNPSPPVEIRCCLSRSSESGFEGRAYHAGSEMVQGIIVQTDKSKMIPER